MRTHHIAARPEPPFLCKRHTGGYTFVNCLVSGFGRRLGLATVANMAIKITNETKKKTTLQFVLPDDVHDGPVSAVGSFNGWQPGAHKLVKRSNGTRSVSVKVPAGTEVHFRYLGSGGVWFDDPEVADGVLQV
jgi:hypothetical protein